MENRHLEHHAGDPDALISRAIQDLREHGERVTEPRRRMLQVLAAHHEHLTADDVAAQMNDDGAHRATVYRSLELFAELGIVTHRQLPGGATAYHLATSTHLHAHCIVCGKVVALPSDVFDDAAHRILQLRGFAFDPNRSSILGTCESCRALSRVPAEQ